jgi:erythromycin esterase-like protein
MREELNIGQRCRERFGRDCASIGFGTHAGTVVFPRSFRREIRHARSKRRGSVPDLQHRRNHG